MIPDGNPDLQEEIMLRKWKLRITFVSKGMWVFTYINFLKKILLTEVKIIQIYFGGYTISRTTKSGERHK